MATILNYLSYKISLSYHCACLCEVRLQEQLLQHRFFSTWIPIAGLWFGINLQLHSAMIWIYKYWFTTFCVRKTFILLLGLLCEYLSLLFASLHALYVATSEFIACRTPWTQCPLRKMQKYPIGSLGIWLSLNINTSFFIRVRSIEIGRRPLYTVFIYKCMCTEFSYYTKNETLLFCFPHIRSIIMGRFEMNHH